jgi:hypothetical protein
MLIHQGAPEMPNVRMHSNARSRGRREKTSRLVSSPMWFAMAVSNATGVPGVEERSA